MTSLDCLKGLEDSLKDVLNNKVFTHLGYVNASCFFLILDMLATWYYQIGCLLYCVVLPHLKAVINLCAYCISRVFHVC